MALLLCLTNGGRVGARPCQYTLPFSALGAEKSTAPQWKTLVVGGCFRNDRPCEPCLFQDVWHESVVPVNAANGTYLLASDTFCHQESDPAFRCLRSWDGDQTTLDHRVTELRDVVVAGHRTPGNGGALSVGANATLVVSNVVFRQNQAGQHGGSIYVAPGGRLQLFNASFLGNHAGGCGGAVFVADGGTLLPSTVAEAADNHAQDRGGVFFLNQSTSWELRLDWPCRTRLTVPPLRPNRCGRCVHHSNTLDGAVEGSWVGAVFVNAAYPTHNISPDSHGLYLNAPVFPSSLGCPLK